MALAVWDKGDRDMLVGVALGESFTVDNKQPGEILLKVQQNNEKFWISGSGPYFGLKTSKRPNKGSPALLFCFVWRQYTEQDSS